ncbi:winged helix-turn-helix transcriptional regulator [Roseomonas eburnea]|uniref:Winged helix-turn-helix transcriptional regulator n=1 Tax=Neoroseomonas eburnea TaxID=1346889 RepID=A0A9X9XCU0_9PROT|nr:MarR family winged helix-turn-helix transcriptional regulator [Neoroseomonas eburnea]MBR0681526.1 winged helix-turn-helix transcriptional regulator [Neoroseomonas eburnea]
MSANTFDHPASRLALEVFRLNGALLATGDALVAPLGLTSARWQILGAVAEAGGALTVAGIARAMGLARQSVQRVANDLAAAGLVAFAANPGHRRAPLLHLTDAGRAAFEGASARWGPLADTLLRGIPPAEADAAAALLRLLRTRLDTLRSEEPAP